MSLILRPYQETMIQNVRNALRVHKRVVLQMPTGAGKTACSAKMLAGTAESGKRAFFNVHRQELIDQTAKTLNLAGVGHGFVAAGYPHRYAENILVCSVFSLLPRLKDPDSLLHTKEKPSVIVWDEAHHCAAGTWNRIAERYPDALHIGLSATPERPDGKGLDHMFRALIPGPSPKWLINEGWLCDFRLFTHPAPNLSGIRRRGAAQEFDQGELNQVMDDPKIVGDAVEHYMDICPGVQFVAFCVSVEHAIRTRDAFRAAGICCEEVDGNTPTDERRRIIDAFRAHRVKGLTSVDLFGEGFDLPDLVCAILLCPTWSLPKALQQVGRTFRPVYLGDPANEALIAMSALERKSLIAEGRKPIAFLLDHAGNFGINGQPHGMPDDERDWSLAGRKKKAKDGQAPPARLCPNCFGANAAHRKTCSFCGWAFEVNSREVDEIPGNLEEIDRERERITLASAPAKEAQTFEDAIAIFAARNHPAPWSAAAAMMKGQGRPVTEGQYYAVLMRVANQRGYKERWVAFQGRVFHERKYGEMPEAKGEAA